MLSRCRICGELLIEPSRVEMSFCLICLHRTTPAERIAPRKPGPGLMDSA
jgi:hypothetical protein